MGPNPNSESAYKSGGVVSLFILNVTINGRVHHLHFLNRAAMEAFTEDMNKIKEAEEIDWE